MPLLPRALFAGLIDDAAVFPPGNSPLDAAVAGHRRLRRSPDADLVGPLLLPASSIAAAADLAGLADLTPVPRDSPGGPLRDPEAPEPAEESDASRPQDAPVPLGVVVIGRPGADLDAVSAAARLARDDPRLTLRAVEIGWFEGWRELGIDAPTVVLELPRGTEQALTITDVATVIAEAEPGPALQVKYRTGATPTWEWPQERELARVIQSAIAMEVPLKLTGGLHHAVRSTREDGEHHGVLNVLAMTAAARAGKSHAQLTSILAQRDPEPLIASLAELNETQVGRIRGSLTAYGCCTVREPIGELIDLGVLEGDS